MDCRLPNVFSVKCMIFCLAFTFISCSSKEKPSHSKPNLDYEILKQEDLSYSAIVKIQFRIRLNESVTTANLRSICEYVISEQKKTKPHNAISFLFYIPDSAGKADWAPNGKWENAGNVRTGDYSQHKLIIKIGSAIRYGYETRGNDYTGIYT